MRQGVSFLWLCTEGLLCWVTCLIYFRPLPKRDRFYLRVIPLLALAIGVQAGVHLLIPLQENPVPAALALVAFGVAMGRGSWKAEWGTSFYLSIWFSISYLLPYELWAFLCYHGFPEGIGFLYPWLIRMVLAVGIYLPLGLTVFLWMPIYISGHVGPRQTVSAAFLYAVFVALAYLFFLQVFPIPLAMTGVLVFMSQLYILTVLYLQTALFRKSEIKQELDTLNLLWHQQKAQYQMSKETIDLINRKCHDLKHQVAAMRTLSSEEGREQYLQEIEDSVQIYDCMVQTGNETLDTVLTEKRLLCEAGGITVNCVADGSQVGFMDPVDLYTILGNALDNAMEGVKAFPNREMRVIDVLIHTRQRFLVLSVTNPLKEALTFREGLPVSIKPKDGYHGFGMRSMRYTVHKYGGELTVETKNGCFSLRIMIPLPPSEGEGPEGEGRSAHKK